jgi:hypothetical protein
MTDRHISALDDEPEGLSQSELPFDSGDAAQVKEKIKEARFTQERRLQILKDFLGSPDGRAWFYDLLGECGIYRNPAIFASTNATFFSCGEINIGQKILAQITEADPGLYMQMLKESKDG